MKYTIYDAEHPGLYFAEGEEFDSLEDIRNELLGLLLNDGQTSTLEPTLENLLAYYGFEVYDEYGHKIS